VKYGRRPEWTIWETNSSIALPRANQYTAWYCCNSRPYRMFVSSRLTPMSCHSSAYGHLVFSHVDILTGSPSPSPSKKQPEIQAGYKKIEDLMNFWRCVTGSVRGGLVCVWREPVWLSWWHSGDAELWDSGRLPQRPRSATNWCGATSTRQSPSFIQSTLDRHSHQLISNFHNQKFNPKSTSPVDARSIYNKWRSCVVYFLIFGICLV